MKPFYKKLFWALVIIINIFFNPVTLVIAWFSWGAPWLKHGQFYRKPTFRLELTKTQVYYQSSLDFISDIQQVKNITDPSTYLTWIVGRDGAVKVDAKWRKQTEENFKKRTMEMPFYCGRQIARRLSFIYRNKLRSLMQKAERFGKLKAAWTPVEG